MHGLTRVRQFTITEAHNVIRPDQTEEELSNCFNLAYHILTVLGLEKDVTFRLSKWDPENKKNSKSAAYSVIALLKNLASPLTFF